MEIPLLDDGIHVTNITSHHIDENNITLFWSKRAKQATAFKRRSIGVLWNYMAISIWIGLLGLFVVNIQSSFFYTWKWMVFGLGIWCFNQRCLFC